MRITHLGKYYPPEMGGIETVTQTIVQGQTAQQHEVKVVCFNTDAGGNDTLDGAKILRYPVNRFIGSQPMGFAYFIDGMKHCLSVDVVHLHAPNLLAALMALILPSSVKLVVHWHSDVIGKGWLGRLVRPLEFGLLKRADAVIATSPRYAEGSVMLRRVLSKVSVIPLSLRPAVKPPQANDEPLPSPLLEFIGNRRLILATGRLVSYKGFNYLIEAVPELPADVAVVIVGDGPLRQTLSQQIEQAGLQDRVKLAGRVSNECLASLLSMATLFCLPSIERSEAFGMVLLEAMSHGLPVVCTDVPGSGMPWVNQHEVSGLNVTPCQGRAIAQGCNRILDSPSLHQSLSEGAKRRFDTLFTATICDAQLAQLYTSLLSQKG